MARHLLIEKTAGELAATFYEAARSAGMKSQYKNARLYAAAYLELWIPKAVEILTELLSKDHISTHMKNEIYDALLERANDKTNDVAVKHLNPDYMPPPDWKPDDAVITNKDDFLKACRNAVVPGLNKSIH